jgi:hypothetical protein
VNPRLLTYGSVSPVRNDGSKGGAGVSVVWVRILVVSGTRVVGGVCCVCTIPGSVAFFRSEILCCDVFGVDGAGVVHPATSMTIHSALNKIKKILCINPAKRKRAIKVLIIFEMEKKFLW